MAAQTPSAAGKPSSDFRYADTSQNTEQVLREEPVPKGGKQKTVPVNYRKSQPSKQPNGQRKSKKAVGNHGPRPKHGKQDE